MNITLTAFIIIINKRDYESLLPLLHASGITPPRCSFNCSFSK